MAQHQAADASVSFEKRILTHNFSIEETRIEIAFHFFMDQQITSSLKAYRYLQNKIISDVEEFWVIALNTNKLVIKSTCLFRGTVDACLVHPRDIFRFACLQNSSSILISHNHPSADPTPSEHDIKITQRIYRCSQYMQIPLVDHIVLASNSYVSFHDQKIRPFR